MGPLWSLACCAWSCHRELYRRSALRADAVVLGEIEGRLDFSWRGLLVGERWRERIGAGWTGDLALVFPAPGELCSPALMSFGYLTGFLRCVAHLMRGKGVQGCGLSLLSSGSDHPNASAGLQRERSSRLSETATSLSAPLCTSSATTAAPRTTACS